MMYTKYYQIGLTNKFMNDYFKKELIMVDLVVEESAQVIKILSDVLFRDGYVKESFYTAVMKREKEFPTGIPTCPVGIAIPHTDEIHVNKMAIAVGILKNPIKFGMMGGDGEIDVDLVFLLALKDNETQVSLLQCFSEFFQKTGEIEKIRNAGSCEAVWEILCKEIQAIS